MQELLIEAESLKSKGGWVVDSGAMEMIHSAYLMAHGMGIPVADAFDNIEIACDGDYALWVLTRDWTATWNIANPAGKFEILIDGKPLPGTLGTNGKDWSWQKAGQAYLTKGIHTISLHDGNCADNSNHPKDPDETEIEKFHYCVERLGIEHKYSIPQKWNQ